MARSQQRNVIEEKALAAGATVREYLIAAAGEHHTAEALAEFLGYKRPKIYDLYRSYGLTLKRGKLVVSDSPEWASLKAA